MMNSKILCLCFHDITESKLTYGVHDKGSITKDKFLNIIEELTQKYDIISGSQLLSLIEKGEIPNRKSVVLTFDDGYLNWKNIVFPELISKQIPGIFFITSGYSKKEIFSFEHLLSEFIWSKNDQNLSRIADKLNIKKDSEVLQKQIYNNIKKKLRFKDRNYVFNYLKTNFKNIFDFLPKKKMFLSSSDIIEFASSDFIEFGNHSQSHLPIIILDNKGIEKDISLCCSYLADLGIITPFYAYPYGVHHLSETSELLRRKFKLAFTTEREAFDLKLGYRYKIPRITIDHDFEITSLDSYFMI